MARRKTHEEFVAEVKALVGDEYEVLSRYKNSRTKISMKHETCGDIYPVTPSNFLKGRRCPNCSKLKGRTTEDFKREVFKLVGREYEVLGAYINAITKIRIKHKKCGETYSVVPNSFLRGSRCPNCYGTHKKTTEEFKKEVFKLVEGEYEVIGDYINTRTKIRIKHKKCGKKYEVLPKDFLRGSRCPNCNESKGERFVSEWLTSKGIYYDTQYPIKTDKFKRPLRLDFYIQGVAIEYDGKQHYEPIEYFGGETALRETQRRDRIKDKYCADNGIPLIRIPYWEYDNIDAILTEKLLPLLKDNNVNPTQKQAVGM